MVKLYGTINVHLLIINAIMYFVAPIVLQHAHTQLLFSAYFIKFISIYKTQKNVANKTQISNPD